MLIGEVIINVVIIFLDTIAVMKNYNFDQPIKTLIIYEDYDIKPNDVTGSKENNLISKDLKEDNQILIHAINQRDLYTKNGTMHDIDIHPYRTMNESETEISKRGFNSCHKYMLPKSTMNTYPYMRNPLINGKKANLNNNSTVKKSILYNTNFYETVLLNQVAENLALIIEDYVHYYNFSYTSCDIQQLALLKSQCYFRKLHYFEKCSIFEELLIQHENNMQFITSLTTKIVQCAKVAFPYKLLSIIFKDLLEWIKLNKNQKTNIFQQNPMPNETLPAESFLPISNVYLENGNHNHQHHNKPYSKMFSQGSPGSRILNTDPQILTQQRIESNTYQEYTTVTNVSNQNLHNPTIAKSSNIDVTHSTEHHIPRPYYVFMNESNQHNKQPTTSSTTPLNLNSTYFFESRMNPRECIHDNYNIINNSSSYLDANHINTQDATRNSISRDSGFTSPVTSISPSESMVR